MTDDSRKKYMIATTVDGCIVGNYYTEIGTYEEMEKILNKCKKVDPNAHIVQIVNVRKENV